MTPEEKRDFLEYLSLYITDNKRQKFDEVLKNRTKHITVILEDIYQPHNASAVLRSCDSFGIQDVHVIENTNTYEVNPHVELGTAKWLDLYRYNQNENNTLDCIQKLKSKGYKVLATSPHKNDITIDEIDINDKIALMFGKEKEGLSDLALKNADGYVKIPMYGFVESLNISVSAAICLRRASEMLRKSEVNWQLSENEVFELKLKWAKKVVKHSHLHEQEFLSKR